jgi:hypothetical protein
MASRDMGGGGVVVDVLCIVGSSRRSFSHQARKQTRGVEAGAPFEIDGTGSRLVSDWQAFQEDDNDSLKRDHVQEGGGRG